MRLLTACYVKSGQFDAIDFKLIELVLSYSSTRSELAVIKDLVNMLRKSQRPFVSLWPSACNAFYQTNSYEITNT